MESFGCPKHSRIGTRGWIKHHEMKQTSGGTKSNFRGFNGRRMNNSWRLNLDCRTKKQTKKSRKWTKQQLDWEALKWRKLPSCVEAFRLTKSRILKMKSSFERKRNLLKKGKLLGNKNNSTPSIFDCSSYFFVKDCGNIFCL